MGLTEKEIRVLELRSNGLTQVEVARKLNISQAAVSSFEQNAQRKLRDAEEMLVFARRLKLTTKKSPYEVRK